MNKRFHVFNQPYTEENYRRAIDAMLRDRTLFEKGRAEFEKLKLTQPHKYYAGISNENVTGDHVSYSKNAQHCFDCTYDEDCARCTWLHKCKECRDCYAWGLSGELGYENHLCGNNFYNVQFSESCWNSISNLLYCRYCLDGSRDLFGCVSLCRHQYCILNKQYTKEEYEKLAGKLIEHMRRTGEWGEFFPHRLSPYGYNETVAQEYYPLSKEEVLRRGWNWYEETQDKASYLGPTVTVPPTIEEVTDDICQKILLCEVTGRPYKIIPQELEFYRDMRIPLPRKCFDQRHEERRLKRNPRKLWSRHCAKCNKEIDTTYSPDRPEIVYCEDCYLKEVY